MPQPGAGPTRWSSVSKFPLPSPFALICLVVFGQMAGSLLLDHFGVLHPRQPADALRVFGVVLVAVGALLVVKPWQQG